MIEDKRKNTRELSEIEKKTYNFIKDAGEIQTSNIHDKHICGAAASLKNMGLVEVFKKYTSYYRKRKKKFIRITSKSLPHNI
jgi:prenyltransferase beta subunit